jgi:hypothetical protein
MLFVICYVSLFAGYLQDYELMGSDRILGMTSFADVISESIRLTSL